MEHWTTPGHPTGPLLGASGATTPALWRLGGWGLPAINAVGVLATIGAISYRLWQAHLPAYALQAEAAVIGVATVLALVGVSIRASRFAGNYAIRLTLAVFGLVLAMVGLGIAGPWLGNDLPPLPVVT